MDPNCWTLRADEEEQHDEGEEMPETGAITIGESSRSAQ